MSVPTNIVEGRSQESEASFARFLKISLASLNELEYHLLAARDIAAISVAAHLSLSSQVETVRMMLHALLRELRGVRDKAGSAPRKVNV